MSDRACTQVGSCTVCEAVPYQPAVPDHFVTDPVQGWNSGARSQRERVGGVRVKFEVGSAAGVVLGLTTPGTFQQHDPSSIAQGVFLFTQGGVFLAQIVEYGAPQGEPFTRALGDLFEIRRRDGVATYLHNDTPIHTSPAYYDGPTCVGACLYLTGDTVG